MQSSKLGGAVLAAVLLLSACGSDDAPLRKGWTTDENLPPVEEPIETDAGPDLNVEPDVTIVEPPPTCETLGCPVGQACSEGVCVTLPCANDDQCPEGLACAGADGQKICQPPTGAADGEPCSQDTDCQGGTCITDWPGGFCTTLGCESFEDCSRLGNENRCLQVRGPDLCVRMCTQDSDCRDQYICQMFNAQQGMCSPDPSQPIDPAVLANNPFDVNCVDVENGIASIDYNVAADTTSYMITPLTISGRELRPRQINRPSGLSTTFNGPNAFQTVPSEIYGSMNPTIVPAIETFANQLETGAHTYQVNSAADQVCWYMIEETVPGDSLDLNVYLVGLPGLTAANAAEDQNLRATLDNVDAIYRTAGYKLGKIRYFDVSDALAQQFAIVRDESTLPELLKSTTRPGNSLDEALSVNVFFVRGFNLGGTIGISYGLPGPAGLHGTQGSGVVFTSQYMGGQTTDGLGNPVDGNIFTSQVLAHEVGHYLGLFHTSESNGFNFDPLPDTPQCTQISGNCPDISNLMFPFASSMSANISRDQAFVMGVNPLTKPTATAGDNR